MVILDYLAFMILNMFYIDYIFIIWYNNLLKYAKKEYFR